MNTAELVCTPILDGSFPRTFGALGSSWLELSAIAILVSLLFLVLTYMLAALLSHKQLTVWARFELFQIFGTAVVFLFSLVAVTGICTFDMGLLSPSYDGLNMYQIVDDYFNYLQEVGVTIFLYITYIVGIFTNLSKITWASTPMGVGSTDAPLESLGQINNIFFFVMSGFTISYLLLGMQMKMLQYIAYATLFYLFPFGLFFRCFEPTRAFGGTLIGISLAFFLFYPVVIVFNDYILFHELYEDGGTVDEIIKSSRQLSSTLGSTPLAVTPDKVLEALPNGASGDERDELASGVSGTTFFMLKPAILYFIAAVLLPVINFIVLVEITRSLTHFLGEEIDVSNLTRLI